VREVASRRNSLADCLGMAVERCLLEEQLELMPSVQAIQPGVALPPTAATLVRTLQHFPGQSTQRVRALVTKAAPSTDRGASGSFDRLQAAKAYMGCIHFGYSLAQEYRSLDVDAAGNGPKPFAEREMRSEVAWVAASRRAESVLSLRGEEVEEEEASAHGGGGHSALREFPVGEEELGLITNEGHAAEHDRVHYSATGFQTMLAEACLYGWFLADAEAEARSLLQRDAAEALLTPPAR